MDKQALINRLLEMPEIIEAHETNVLNAQHRVNEAKQTLADKEAELLLSAETVNGKNAEIRNAQLRQLTDAERTAVTEAEKELMIARAILNRRINEFAALRAIARLLGKEVD